MGAVGSIGSSGSSFSVGQSQGVRHGRGPQKLSEDLTSFLTTQGISDEDQQQIISEIKDSLSANKSSSSQRPDPSQVLKSVSEVLKAHGLSVEDFAQNFAPPPGAAAGKPPRTEDQDSTLQKLLDLLAKEFKKAQEKRKAEASATQLASQSTTPSTTSGTTSGTATDATAEGSTSNSPYAAIIELAVSQGEFNVTA